MRNIMIEIEYDGTNYCGWQVQQNGITVQGEIMKVLKRFTGEDIIIHGSGRTDTGVHARGQVANFILESNIPTERIALAMNTYLPEDITITKAIEVPMDFHSRYSAVGKRYSYQIYEGRHRSALLRNYSYHVQHELDHNKIREAAKLLVGTHDFRGFMTSKGSNVKTTIRTIHSVDIVENGQSLWIYIEGNGFLYNMVRIIAGTLVKIGMGKISVNQISKILETKDRTLAAYTAPPQGLFLDKVFYPLTH